MREIGTMWQIGVLTAKRSIFFYIFSEKAWSTSARGLVYWHVWFCEVCFAFLSTKIRVWSMIVLSARCP